MRARLLLFPEAPRDFRGRRGLKIALRALHVLCAAFLLGAYAYESSVAARERALELVIASGAALVLLDCARTAAFLLQVRGAVLLLKIAGVLVFIRLGDGHLVLLVVLFLASVLISHAPGSIRHRMVACGGRIRGADTRE